MQHLLLGQLAVWLMYSTRLTRSENEFAPSTKMADAVGLWPL